MIPRGQLDIGYVDLLYGTMACLGLLKKSTTQQIWPGSSHHLVCLSVRSGLDLLLTSLNLPVGSEIIVSAVNIPDMYTILSQHGLSIVAAPVNKHDLTVNINTIKQMWNRKTKAVLFAHLYGAISDITELCHFAQQHNVIVIEDCAQAYQGNQFRGHPEADVSLFSFGMIKTHTALGGAVLHFKHSSLYKRVRACNDALPQQSQWDYCKKLMTALLIKSLNSRIIYTIFVTLCRYWGMDYEQVMLAKLRGFGNCTAMYKIRKRPSVALTKMLSYRLAKFDKQQILNRISHVEGYETGILPAAKIGDKNSRHTHWVYPILVKQVEQCIMEMRNQGIDVTQRASSLISLSEKDESNLTKDIMKQIIFLPMYKNMTMTEKQKVVEIVNRYV